MNKKSNIMSKDMAVVEFKVLSSKLLGGSEENCEEPPRLVCAPAKILN